MQEKEINLDNALKWIGYTHDQIASKFLADYKQVPSLATLISMLRLPYMWMAWVIGSVLTTSGALR
jgi:ABC-type enterobactin transport system permease subunit